MTPHTTPSGDEVERVARAIEAAQCKGREGPFGGYDYGHNTAFYGPEPEGGRYVIRDFRDPASPDWGKWLHQTNDSEDHERMFAKMTQEHIAQAAIAAMREHMLPSPDTPPVAKSESPVVSDTAAQLAEAQREIERKEWKP